MSTAYFVFSEAHDPEAGHDLAGVGDVVCRICVELGLIRPEATIPPSEPTPIDVPEPPIDPGEPEPAPDLQLAS